MVPSFMCDVMSYGVMSSDVMSCDVCAWSRIARYWLYCCAVFFFFFWTYMRSIDHVLPRPDPDELWRICRTSHYLKVSTFLLLRSQSPVSDHCSAVSRPRTAKLDPSAKSSDMRAATRRKSVLLQVQQYSTKCYSCVLCWTDGERGLFWCYY